MCTGVNDCGGHESGLVALTDVCNWAARVAASLLGVSLASGLDPPVVASRLEGGLRRDIVRCWWHQPHRAVPLERGYVTVTPVPHAGASGRQQLAHWRLHQSRRCYSCLRLRRPRLAWHAYQRHSSVRRPSSTGLAWHSCLWRSFDRPACMYRRGFDVSYRSKAVVS